MNIEYKCILELLDGLEMLYACYHVVNNSDIAVL